MLDCRTETEIRDYVTGCFSNICRLSAARSNQDLFEGEVSLTDVTNAATAGRSFCLRLLPAPCRVNIMAVLLILPEAFEPKSTHLWVHPGWHGLGICVRLCCGVERSVSGGTPPSASEPTPGCRSAPYAAPPPLSDTHENMVKQKETASLPTRAGTKRNLTILSRSLCTLLFSKWIFS